MMKMTMPPATMMTTKMTMNNALHSRAPFFSRLAKVSATTALIATGLALCTVVAGAQQKEPTVRLIQGTVTDKNDKPLPNAVVYLKDEKTLQVKSYLTDEQGHFRFGQLSMSTDYDVWADLGGTHSKTKNVSSFNSKPTIDYTLKIEK